MGRDFLPEEGQAGKDQVAILTHKLWQSLGADPHINAHSGQQQGHSRESGKENHAEAITG
jgi:hypothetical protein